MNAFQDCEALTSIDLPDSLEYISPGLFWGCKALTSVSIPDTVKVIAGSALRVVRLEFH